MRILVSLFVGFSLLTACGRAPTPEPALDPNLAMTAAFATVHVAFSQTALAVPTATPPPTATPVPPFPTPFVPSVTLPAIIKVVIANCRYGPGTDYVAPIRLRNGKVLEAIGHDAQAQWFLVRKPGTRALVGQTSSPWTFEEI